MVLATMGRLNHHAIDSGDFYFYLSDYPFASTSNCVTDADTNMIKSIDSDEMDQLPKQFLSKHDYDLLDIDLHMLQVLLVVPPSSTFCSIC